MKQLSKRPHIDKIKEAIHSTISHCNICDIKYIPTPDLISGLCNICTNQVDNDPTDINPLTGKDHGKK